MKKMINRPKLIPLYDIVKLYFSEYPSIKFSKIKKIMKKFKKELERYTNLSLPLWIGGRAKELSTHTFDFVEKNKYLLSSDKDFYTYQEYHNLIKFEPALKNLSIIAEQIEEVHSVELKIGREKGNKIIGIIVVALFLFWGCWESFTFWLITNFVLVIYIVFVWG